MTLDDDSILSAYLDGQLGPEQQQAVESALFADPQLAEELRGLAFLRDLMAGLSREASPDVTSRVMRRVRRRAPLGAADGDRCVGPVPRRRRWPRSPPVWSRSCPSPGSSRSAADRPAAADRPSWCMAPRPRRRPGRSSPRPSGRLSPCIPPARVRPRRSGPGSAARRRRSRAGDRPAAPGELVHVREYLDNPQLRRIFLVSDLEDGSAQQQVASVVEQTTRFNFYKITISQGIVIDPRHPDRATVFALVVGPRELESLRDRLRAALNDRVEETDRRAGGRDATGRHR